VACIKWLFNKTRDWRLPKDRALTSFLAIERYTPFLVLATGLSTFIGLWGAGTLSLFCIRLRLPSPWNHVTAILLGIQVLSLTVQIAGMAEISSPPVLSVIWWALVSMGAAMLVVRGRMVLRSPISPTDKWSLLPIAIAGTATAINLLIALAPSTKIDELYYHMLVPSRIVSDGALRFYREPWEGAIWPQMVYQISAAPAHAMGYPDAANVVSWGLSTTLLWFAWQVIRGHARSVGWSALWIGTLCVGIYPAVWHVTGGAHAMGDLAMAAAIIAFCSRERLLGSLSRPVYAAMVSVLLLSASTSKISLLPLCGILLCLIAWPLLRSAQPRDGSKVVIALSAPWIIFFCPIAVWTWIQSGSPFGPVLAFASSIYPATWAQRIFQSTRDANQLSLMAFTQDTAIGYSPLVWLGVIGAIFGTDLSKHIRTIFGCLFVMQCTLIYWLLPHDARFLGGLHYGLLIAFAAFVADDIRNLLVPNRAVAAVCAVLLFPWLVIQSYYSKQFVAVSLGQEKTAFYERYVAFYADYVKLDQILPKGTVLLVQDFRLDAAYAPRPVFFDYADLPPGKQAVLFARAETIRAAGTSSSRHKPGDLVYENPQAVAVTYRTPGKHSWIDAIQVATLRTD